MLRFFRFNDPYRLLFVFVAILVLGIKAELEFPSITLPELKGILVGEMMADGKQLYSQVWDSMPPVTACVHYIFNVLFDRALLPRHIASLVLIFFQAAFFGVILINNKAFNESNYLPSLLFGLLCFFSFDSVSLTREIIGSTLLLLAINMLLREIEFKRQQDETIHNLGFYLGLASLSNFSSIVFFIGSAILLMLFSRLDLRRFSLFVFGFLLPHLLMNTWYFWKGELSLLWTNFYFANINSNTEQLINSTGILVILAVPAVYFSFSLFMIRRDASLSKYQSQIMQVMFFWFVFGLIEIYLTAFRTPQAFLVCVPPVAYFMNHLMHLIRRKWLAELSLWIFIACLLGISTLVVKKVVPSVDWSKMLVEETGSINVKGKKILVLEDTLAPYLQNSTSSFFLDWALTYPVFHEPGYYQNILSIDAAFEKDPPEVIIDPQNLMVGVFEYLPQWQAKYKREGGRYVKLD